MSTAYCENRLIVVVSSFFWDYFGLIHDLPAATLSPCCKFYVKLNFEIAVDQKGGTQDQTFEGVDLGLRKNFS